MFTHCSNYIFSFALIVIFTLCPTPSQAQEQPLNQRNIQVSGQGSVAVVPDFAAVRISLMARDRDVSKAVNDTEKAMAALIQSLKSRFDTEPKDIQTAMIRVYPVFINCRNDERLRQRGLSAEECDGSAVDYYNTQRGLNLRFRDLDRFPELLSYILEQSDENQVMLRLGGIQLKTEKEEELKTEARRRAANKVREKARRVAEELGSELGKALQINVDNVRVPAIPIPVAYANPGSHKALASRSVMMEAAPSYNRSDSIAPGEINIEARISAIFALE